MFITSDIFNKYKKEDGFSSWRSYINGNYIVNIDLDTGTKERIQPDDNVDFVPEFPESIDCTITNKCTLGCQYCYAGCTPDGKEADVRNAKFFDTLKPYTEIALQVNELDHPDLLWLLDKLRKQNVIVNITVNEAHFMEKRETIKNLVEHDLVKGIGVSYWYISHDFIEEVKKYPNAVLHVINGLISNKLLEPLYNQDLKILILGYKEIGRGVDYKEKKSEFLNENQRWLYNNIPLLLSRFKLLSFDNLALEQLNIKRFLSKAAWDDFYMGDDGDYTFFIDLVTNRFGQSSLALANEMYPLTDNVTEMFDIIRCLKINKKV